MPAPSITLAAIRQPALLYDADGRCAEMNEAARALAGRPFIGLMAGEVIGLLDIRGPGGAPLAPDDLPASRVLAGGVAVDVPLTARGAGGRSVHNLVSASLLRDGDRVVGALECWQDVSAFVEASAAAERSAEKLGRQGAELARIVTGLKRQRGLLDAIFARLPHLVSVWDQDRRLIWANERFAAGLSVPLEVLVGTSWGELGCNATVFRPIVDEATLTVSAGREYRHEVEVPGPGGATWLDVTAVPIFDDSVLTIAEDVTGRRQVEDELRRSLERLRLAQESAGIGIWDHDTASDRVTVLSGFLRRYGLEAFSLATFADIFQLVHPGDRERVDEWRKAFVPGGEPQNAEFRLVIPTGEERWIQFRGRAVADTRGAPPRVIGVLIDVTDHRRAEEALRESEQRHAFLLALGDRLREFAESPGIAAVAAEMTSRFLGAGGVVFCEVDAAGSCTTDSSGWTDGTVPVAAGRFRPDDLGIGDDYRRGVVRRHGDAGPGAPGARASLGVPIRRGHRLVAVMAVYSARPRAWTDAEVELVREVGDRVWVAVHRARTEAALREREQTLQGIFRAAPVGIGMISHRTFTMVNDRFCRMTGYGRDELIGRDTRLLYPDDEAYEYVGREKYARIVAEGIGAVETRWRRKDGTVLDVLLSSSPVDRSRPNEDVVFNALDITRLRDSERALESYMDDLQRSNEELQRFAYVASHDLQEPLRSIVSFSQLLKRRYGEKLDADADEYIAFIVEGGNRMQTLITDLLQLSRVETKARPLVSTDAGKVVADALRLMETPIREADATIEVGEMPTVLADAAQLEQVFANLVGNALKYRRPDIPCRVRISAKRANGLWRFSVADNGIGIEPEYFDRIFVIFQRLHTREEYEGTGIGLAVVRKIVERHGGRIGVESTPGEGSTFFFTLPAG